MGMPLLRLGSTERTLRMVSQMPVEPWVYFWLGVSYLRGASGPASAVKCTLEMEKAWLKGLAIVATG